MEDVAGDAWARWTGALAGMGDRLTAAGYPTDDRGRAEGIRHLARQANLALRGELEHSDVRHPHLHKYELPWSQWGAPNPDNVYLRCAVDPAATYVLRGNVTGAHEILFSLVEGDMHLDENGVYAEVALSDLDVGSGGDLELVIGPGGQLAAPAGQPARLLLIREYLWDWANDPIVSLTIEREDTAGESAPAPTSADVAAALDRAAHWVARSIDHWAAYVAASRDLLEHNTFTPPATPPGGAPSIAYGGGCWDLGPDEALVVEHDEPDAHYWNWSVHQLHRFDSGAWDDRLMSCNGHQAHVDTEGHPIGMTVYRYVGAGTKPVPSARVVPVAELRDALPADHPVVDGAARRAQLAARNLAAQRRWS